ncbi:MAG: hypothetical protein NVSMB18_06090 [Acetobacteraceae bacterium]
MAQNTVAAPSRADALASRTPAGLGATIRRAFARWREVNRIHDELGGLSERELADVGLRRGDIPAVARGTYRR